MATTILTDFLSVGVVLFFVTFIYARLTKKELGDILDDVVNMIRGGKKDE